MSGRVYGIQSFVTPSDVNLDTFDTDWQKIVDGAATWVGVGSVRTATNDLRNTGAGNTAVYRWIKRTLVNQMVRGKILAVATHYPGLYVRLTATSGYLCEWQATENRIELSRVTAIGTTPVFTSLATGGAVATATNYSAFLKAVDNVIYFGDATNGLFSFTDTAAPLLTGQPGVSLFNVAGLAVAIDDLEIWDEARMPMRRAYAPLGRRRY